MIVCAEMKVLWYVLISGSWPGCRGLRQEPGAKKPEGATEHSVHGGCHCYRQAGGCHSVCTVQSEREVAPWRASPGTRSQKCGARSEVHATGPPVRSNALEPSLFPIQLQKRARSTQNPNLPNTLEVCTVLVFAWFLFFSLFFFWVQPSGIMKTRRTILVVNG